MLISTINAATTALFRCPLLFHQLHYNFDDGSLSKLIYQKDTETKKRLQEKYSPFYNRMFYWSVAWRQAIYL